MMVSAILWGDQVKFTTHHTQRRYSSTVYPAWLSHPWGHGSSGSVCGAEFSPVHSIDCQDYSSRNKASTGHLSVHLKPHFKSVAWYICITVDGDDYTSSHPQDVTIPAGLNRTCVNFTIINDDIAEELHEQFKVTFTIPNTAEARLIIATNSSAIVTIVDNDGECVCKGMSIPCKK